MRRLILLLSLLVVIPRAGHAQTTDTEERRKTLERDGVMWGSKAAWVTPFREDISREQKVAGLARFWMEVKINFPHFAEVPDLDWDKTFVDYLPQVEATRSTYEYYKVLQRMCALLNDGHTNVFLPDTLAKRMEAVPPIRTDLVDARVFVTSVESPTLQAAGIVPGLEITAIDGVPVRAYAEKDKRPYVSSNSPQHRDVQVYSYALLAGPRARPVSVTFRTPAGTSLVRRISRTPYADRAPLPTLQTRTLDDGVAYVAINTFNDEGVTKAFEQVLSGLTSAPGLIVDVRQNDGGSGVAAYDILGFLTDSSFATPHWKTRQYAATGRAWGEAGGWVDGPNRPWQPKPGLRYRKPVVLITGPRALSATDVFAAAFQDIHRGPIVGEPTGGSSGDPLPFALPGGGSGRVATSIVTDHDFVGHGVRPDVLVAPTPEDVVAGHDVTLEAARREIATLIHRP